MKKHNKSYQRSDRVKEQMLRILSEEIRQLRDKRLGIITLTDIRLTRDYSFADVYFTILDEDNRDEVEKALNAASGRLRNELSRKITLFRMPELSFIYDESEVNARNIDQLLHQISKERPLEIADDE